jgi:outer membrane protein TolC
MSGYVKNIINTKVRIRNMVFLLISICLYSFQSLSAYSQTDSLSHYVDLAIKNNPSLQQKFSLYKAALQKIPQAGSLPDPELTTGVLLQKMELMQGYQVADLQLMQMFPWFGVLKNAKDEMNLMAKAKFESYVDTRSGLEYDVRKTWYELNKINQEIRITRENIDILKTIERLTLVRFQSPVSNGRGSSSGGLNSSSPPTASKINGNMQKMGENSSETTSATLNSETAGMGDNSMGQQQSGSGLADLYRIQIEAGDLENNIATFKDLMITLTSRFNSYLNRPAMYPVSLSDSLIAETFNLSIISVSDSMLLNNPMLAMLNFEKESVEARARMMSDMGYPMVGLGVKYSIISKFPYANTAMNGKDMIMPMVTVTLPVYRKKYKAMKSEADLEKTAAGQAYTAASTSLINEFYEAVQLYNDSQRRQKLYTGQALLADKSLNILLKSFSSSNVNLTDFLRVRQQNLEYQIKEIEAIADYNTSVAWIKKLENLSTNGNE